MPIPTSLIVVLLVVAWLAVLVPMVARRREHVPEAQEDGARFRVLRRASATLKRRRPSRATAEMDGAEADLDDETDEDPGEDPGDLEEELMDDEDDEAADDLEEAPQPVFAGSTPLSTARRGQEAVQPTAVRVSEPAYSVDEEEDAFGGPRPEPVSDHRVRARDDRYQQPEQAYPEDDERYRPVPQRRGRGGYDPEAAEATRTYRYKRRRRVTLFLLLATIAFSVAAYYLRPVLWFGTAFFAVLLVAYLAYLRRQVRIEENIRQRRLAKLRRARQIRPEYHVGPATAPVTFSALSAPVHSHGRRVVDLDDDDPTFDDLEYYQPVAYRRASGQ